MFFLSRDLFLPDQSIATFGHRPSALARTKNYGPRSSYTPDFEPCSPTLARAGVLGRTAGSACGVRGTAGAQVRYSMLYFSAVHIMRVLCCIALLHTTFARITTSLVKPGWMNVPGMRACPHGMRACLRTVHVPVAGWRMDMRTPLNVGSSSRKPASDSCVMYCTQR